MFETLGGFSVVYFALAAVLFLLILFEKPLIALEEKRYETRKAVIKELMDIKDMQKQVIGIQDEVIDLQHSHIKKLQRELSTQHKINSINLETLRQERLMREKENNNGKDR